MRLDGAGAERTTAGVGDAELRVAMEEGTEEHNNRAGFTSGFDIHVVEF